jgi:ATP-dependent protease ClpP protease subunit
MLCLYPKAAKLNTKRPHILVLNKAGKSAAEILLYGYIGGDEIVASDFIRELSNCEKEYSKINIRVNSGGGSIFDGFTMFNAIRNSKADIDIYIEGMAASIASVIAMAGRKCYMSRVGRLMTHRAKGSVYGNADEMRKTAELLEGLEKDIAGIYANRTGLSVEASSAKYLAAGGDRWLTAQEALTEKLIDGIYDAPQSEPKSPQNATEKEMWQAYEAIGLPENLLSEIETHYVL